MFLNFYPSVSLSFSADFLSTDPFSSAKIYSLNFLGGKTVEPLVTIIVPVYNTQEYLTRCLDSIVNQSYRHFELLLIDDGSRDDSGRICDDYAAKDSRIKVFHLENGGVSNARNFALNHASREYIQFLDSDDWISPEATRLFVRTITTSQCDMVISDFYRVSGKRLSQKGDIEEDGVMTRQEFANIMLENPADFYYGVLWNKFYRREIIESVHLRMDPQISWCEDFLFNLEYIRHANSFAALQVPVYYYVKRKGSLISTQSINLTNTMKMKLNVFEYYNRFYKDVYDEEAYENIRLQVYRFFITSAKDGIVPPLSGSQKLGNEKTRIHKAALAGDDAILDAYRDRKLLEYYFDTVSKKNSLSLPETMVLYYLHHSGQYTSIRDLADCMQMSSRMVSVSLQKLIRKNIIRFSSEKKLSSVTFLPLSETILKDLELAETDFRNTRFLGFSKEEIAAYTESTKKIRSNIQAALFPL